MRHDSRGFRPMAHFAVPLLILVALTLAGASAKATPISSVVTLTYDTNSGTCSESRIFSDATGIYGTTLEYAHRTLEELRRHNIRDRHLERLLKFLER